MDNDPEKYGLVDRVKNSFKSGARPGFLGGEGEGEAPSGSKAEKRAEARATASGAAADSLKNAEGAASGELPDQGDGLEAARENEQDGGGFYSGSVTGRAGNIAKAAEDIKKGNFKGAFKKVGPLTGIILSIFIFGGVMSGTQLFQPFALIAQFQESFNSMHVSAYNRSARFIRYQMDNGRLKDPRKGTIFGSQKFSLSKKQIEKFEEQGIKYNSEFQADGGGKKYKVLEYETDGGQQRIVTATKSEADDLRNAGVKNAISFDAVLNDSTFSHKFMVASQTWRGQFANWFGTNTGEFLKNNKLTRNMFKDWEKTKAEAEANGKTALDAVKETIKNRLSESESGGVARKEQRTNDSDETIEETTTTNNSKTDPAKIREKLDGIKGKITGGVNIGCAVADFIGVVNLMVAAHEAMQIINITTAYMEAVDKTKAGYGTESPINELATTLNEQIEIDHNRIVSGDGGSVSEGGETKTLMAKTEKVDGTLKSAMQSAGMAALFGNGLTDPHDASVQSFNLTSSINAIAGGVGMSVDSFRNCAIGRVTAAVANIVGDVAICVATFGVGCMVDLLKDIGFSVGIALAIQGVIELLTPWLVSEFERDLVSNLAGEDLGNALVLGANMYQGYIHKANGGSLATEDKYKDFAIARQQVIAEEAREERENLSPFDMTSKNTFMGSLLTRLMSFNTSSSLMSTLTSASSVMSSSLVSLSPSSSATAFQIAETLPDIDEYAQICPYLAEIGAIGDSFCNPYMVTDIDTLDDDPADVIDSISDQFEDNETSDGNVKIKKDSDLMNYIKYCGNRTSSFGVADQNIAADFKFGIGHTVVDTAIGAAPIFGDLVDIFDGGSVMTHIGYISGESCVAGNGLGDDSFATDSPKWGTAKYYQRFIEDQSLAESMGVIDKSAVTVALEEYYEESPIDESYEGQLARWSGLDKETVSDMLDVIAYYNYVNNYDASERYAFGVPVVDEGEKNIQFEQEEVMSGMTVALEGIVYDDVRNRTFVI